MIEVTRTKTGIFLGFTNLSSSRFLCQVTIDAMVNGVAIKSPLLRSVLISPFASGAGHIAGGTVGGLLEGQNLGEALAGSVEGIWESIAMGEVIGVASTIATCYATKINPWNGKGNISPYEKGCQGVDRAIKDFIKQGGSNIQREVTIEVDGVRIRVDFMGYDKNGMLQLYEIKNGPYAKFTHNQSIVIPKLQQGASFIPYGKNAINAGLPIRMPYTGDYNFNYIHYK